jgi:hypothetical protein
MQVTLNIPDELARRLDSELRELPEIIASGLRFHGLGASSELTDEILAFLAKGPRPAEILAFRPSTASIDRSRELLQKNRTNSLTVDETAELDEMGLMDHLMTLLKAKAHRYAGAPA